MNLDKTEIVTALAGISQNKFEEAARQVLSVLGYQSERVPPEQSGDVGEFIDTYPAENPNTKSEQCFRKNVKSVNILFQMTDSEIGAVGEQDALFTGEGFDKGNTKSFMFATVQTGGGVRGISLPRGTYANIAREINKRFSMPTVVLFKTSSNLFSLAFVQRRPHKRDPNRDVLGRVSLVREINTHKPHRAHRDILDDLSLTKRIRWIDTKGKRHNFDGLLDAWLDALDTEELNQKFYRQLFTWFERAVREAKFPTDERKVLGPEEHIIRLITRLLFIWFIKEKGLVAPELFVQEKVKHYLKNYDQEQGDSYYRVVLQNLFFSTLNTQIGKRNFSKADQSSHRDFNRYRYQDEIADVDGLLALFAQTPFINGGLFECLDSFENYTAGGYRIDCFTDNVNDPSKREYQMVSVPNRLFFDDDGLITLFDRYKFTIEESTPVEQEVALDPELLGKVFENLLAAYNPETRETARKATGSYYTPSVIVNYMVDEVLIESLTKKVDVSREHLRYLFDYEDVCNIHELFQETERERLVQAISEITIIDPAVGSGAFLIEMIHKLTLALRRLDPDNVNWLRIQRERALRKTQRAFVTDDYRQRANELAEINETFEIYKDSDYGRKLYLIQNSIFGIDIQLIACQIAKLRFFISLIIEQNSDKSKDNFGIKPLPNLETHILAADTLIPLEGPKQRELQSVAVLQLEHEISENRERYYHANTRNQKWYIIRDFENLRLQLVDALRESGFPSDASEKIASWSPYDQNSCADWFDPEYMFGITEGFDIVIGNPPYIQLQKDEGKLGNRYEKIGYSTFIRIGDIYQLFYEKGCQLLNPEGGLLCYITSNSWLKAIFGSKTRSFFASNYEMILLIETGKDVFENAVVDTSIVMCRSGTKTAVCKAIDMDRYSDKSFPPSDDLWGEVRPKGDKPWRSLPKIEHNIVDKMEKLGKPLGNWDITIYRGITTGLNEVFVIDEAMKQYLIDADPHSAEIIKPVLRGSDVRRYKSLEAKRWIIYTRKGIDIDAYPSVSKYLQIHQTILSHKVGSNRWFELQSSPSDNMDSMYKAEKLFWRRVSTNGIFAYVPNEMFAVNAVCILSGKDLKYLCALLNSKCVSWYVEPTLPRSGTGTFQWEIAYVKTLPIPALSTDLQQPFVDLVDKILGAKDRDPEADVGEQEAEIDRMVYNLYELTEEEIAIVEGE